MSLYDVSEKVNELANRVSDLEKDIKANKINDQLYIRKNTKIPPGIGCKVAYDTNGLILRVMDLAVTDIPTLDISKIRGLQSLLDNKVGISDIERIQLQASNGIVKRSNVVAASGCKINYDKNGFVVSHSDLTSDDIPELSIDKISGLSDIIQNIKNSIEFNHGSMEDTFSIIPSSGCKIYYDNKGRVIKSDSLNMNDIPMDLINRIISLENVLPNLATSEAILALRDRLDSKVDSNDAIVAGEYSKVFVDEKGLVKKGTNLTKDDIPSTIIEDIDSLKNSINTKANQEDMISVLIRLNTLTESLSKVSNIEAIETSLGKKAESSDVIVIKRLVESLQNTVSELKINLQTNLILKQLENLQKDLSDISGKVSVLENKIKEI